MNEKYVFGPFEHGAEADFSRADLEFYGINHYKPSYMVRVFFNDPEVNYDNGNEERASYAGSFSIFGHVVCWGDEGHCELPTGPQRRFDTRPSNPLTRAFKRVVVTNALRKAIDQNHQLTVTLLISSEVDPSELEHHGEHHHHDMGTSRLLDFTGMQLVTFL